MDTIAAAAAVEVVAFVAAVEEHAEIFIIRDTIKPVARMQPIKRAAFLFNVIVPPQ